MTDDLQASAIAGGLINVPGKEAAAEIGDVPEHYGRWNNLAEKDEKTCKAFFDQAAMNFRHFDSQDQREQWTETEGVMDVADRMERCACRKKDTSGNRAGNQATNNETQSDLASTIGYRNLRALYASLNKYFGLLDGDDLPAEYEAMLPSGKYGLMTGAEEADQQNMLQHYTFDEDQRAAKIKSIHWQLAKYGNCLVADEWDRVTEMRDVRRITERDPETGLPEAWEWDEDQEVVIKDCPSLSTIDLKDAWFDAQLESEDWQWLIVRRLRSWDYLNGQQRQGFMANVGKLTNDHLYKGEDYNQDVMTDRGENQGSDADPEPNGLILTYEVFGFAPISENKGKDGRPTGRAKYDAKKNPPKLYWGTIAGELNSENRLPLRLMKTPHRRKKIPYSLIHLLRDDAGAYHDSLLLKGESIYRQVQKNRDQAAENIDLRNRVPWACDGPIKTAKLGGSHWRKNKIVWLGKGTQLKELRVEDTTAFTLPFEDRLESEFQKLVGTDKPIHGEMAFARTAATQAAQNFEQALVPIDDMASYVAEQLYPWMYQWDLEHWRQYGDPRTVISVTHKNMTADVNPAYLSAPMRVKVVAVSRFRNTRTRRQELNNLMQNVITPNAQVLGEDAVKASIRYILEENHFERIEEMNLGSRNDFEARAAAQRDIQMMMSGEFVEPEPQEDHAIRLAVMRPALAALKFISDEDKEAYREQGVEVDQAIQFIEANIQIREQMMEQSAAQVQPQGTPAQSPMFEGLLGEQRGDVIEAQEGELANA